MVPLVRHTEDAKPNNGLAAASSDLYRALLRAFVNRAGM